MLIFKKKTSYSKKKQKYSINFFHYFGVFSFIVVVLFLAYTIPFVKYGFNRIILNNNLDDTLNFFESYSELAFEKIFGLDIKYYKIYRKNDQLKLYLSKKTLLKCACSSTG